MAAKQKIAILGVGLVGGSLGLAIKHLPDQYHIIGIGRSKDSLEQAVARGAVDSISQSLADASDAEIIFVTTPVSLIVPLVKQLVPGLRPGTIITDVGSTKARIVREIEAFVPEGVHYIGGHPMTGSERQGVNAASADLFKSAHYILTPTPTTNMQAFKRLHSLLNAIGAHVLAIDPEKHDRLVATVSHLPHLVAASLVRLANNQASEEENLLLLAAGGFRDTTRIAAADAKIWVDISLDNCRAILEILKKYKVELDGLAKILETRDREALYKMLEEARRTRQGLPTLLELELADLRELFIPVTDRPGIISDVTLAVGNLGINIEDIEILHTTGLAGFLRLTVVGEENAKRAAGALGEKGYEVEIRKVAEKKQV